MESSMGPIAVVDAVELLSCVWMEATFAGVAAVVYIALSGRMVKPFSPTNSKSGGSGFGLVKPARLAQVSDQPRNSSLKGRSCKRVRGADCHDSTEKVVMKDMVNHAKSIQAHGKNNDLQGAIDIFEKVKVTNSVSSLLYNYMIAACVNSSDCERAIDYFEEAKKRGMIDAVTYNLLMKGYLACGRAKNAESTLVQLKQSGLLPTAASYNALLAHRLQSGDHVGVWRLLDEMLSDNVQPCAITCSILLRDSTLTSSRLTRIVGLIASHVKEMDDWLVFALLEACARTGSLKLLEEKKAEYVAQGGTLSAPMYGFIIKAYGQMRDVRHVWALWNEMVDAAVEPTSATFCCTLDALVKNGDTSDAWKLVQQLLSDATLRPLVNTVAFSIILKGFAHSREPDIVLQVYKKMKICGLQPNIITYNTILNAFAQSSTMHHAPALLDDMKSASPPVGPDLVTYSTLVKGYCSSGELDKGLMILSQMRSEALFAPDEMMYNSLLDGCAKEQRLDDALRLVDDMTTSGVAPSNYTLSFLVKLLSRCRRLDQAFTLVETLGKKHGLKINLQVYTCLIHGCVKSRQLSRSLAIHDQALREGLCPDEKFYSALVRGCLLCGASEEAVRMAGVAYGLPGLTVSRSCRSTPPGIDAKCLQELEKLKDKCVGKTARLLAEVNSASQCHTKANTRQAREFKAVSSHVHQRVRA